MICKFILYQPYVKAFMHGPASHALQQHTGNSLISGLLPYDIGYYAFFAQVHINDSISMISGHNAIGGHPGVRSCD
jgi:hypothetical protein